LLCFHESLILVYNRARIVNHLTGLKGSSSSSATIPISVYATTAFGIALEYVGPAPCCPITIQYLRAESAVLALHGAHLACAVVSTGSLGAGCKKEAGNSEDKETHSFLAEYV